MTDDLTSSPPDTSIDRQEAEGAGASTRIEPDGEPAPDPQGMSQFAASNDEAKRDNGAPLAIGPSAVTDAARRQGPQTGVGARAEVPSQAPTPATSTDAESAVLAALIAQGDAAAQNGPAALRNYLDDMPRASKATLAEGQILRWTKVADGKGARR